MTEFYQFGRLSAANEFRETNAEHLCPVDDDRRTKTVALQSDAPQEVHDAAEFEAAASRGDTQRGADQVPLTDAEKSRLDFTKEGVNVFKARSVKGIATAEGVDDWTSYFDPKATVGDHRSIMERAKQDERGGLRDQERGDEERARDLETQAKGGDCAHAEGHCANGDPQACEFLQEECGLTEEEVTRLMQPPDAAPSDAPRDTEVDEKSVEEGLTGQQKGALKRAWGGYEGAVDALADALETARDELDHANAAARAINGIRADANQEPLHFDTLEAANAVLLDLARQAAAECTECHADHAEHDHATTDGEVEDVRAFVASGGEDTPVGLSEDTTARIATFGD